MSATMPPIPRLPVFGWDSLRGARRAGLDCMLDAPNMHYTTSGRASILLALELLGVGPGDRVLLPTYHCPTMVAPAVARGATPLFYPIDERGTPRLDWLVAQDLGRVRVILIAHYFGLPQPFDAFRQWCDRMGIALIEDCAHALFGRSGGRGIGDWGDLAIGSLTKFLPVPEGGCLVINNGTATPAQTRCDVRTQCKAALDIVEDGANHGRLPGLNALVAWPMAGLRALRARASAPDVAAAADVDAESVEGFTIDLPLAHRALAAPCRWLAERLPRERIVERRRLHYLKLAERLSGRDGLRPLLPVLPDDCAPYVFPLWVDRPDPGYAELRRLAMPVFRWDRVWHGVPSIDTDHGVEWSHHVLQLACHQDISDTAFERFVATLLMLYAEPSTTGPTTR